MKTTNKHSRVSFTGITIEGFGSIQREIYFPLNHYGLNMVYGENGQGKTTMFSALVWALYGSPLKDIKKDDIPTWQQFRLPEFKGTRVVVHMNVDGTEFEIARHIGYNGKTRDHKGANNLLVFQNGKLIQEAQHNKQTQEYINELLGMDVKGFTNSIVFGQRAKRLVEADNNEKRALFEQLFETEFVNDLLDRAKTRQQADKEALQTAKAEADRLADGIHGIDEKIQKEQQNLAEYKTERAEKLERMQGHLDTALAVKKNKQDRLKALLDQKKELELALNRDKQTYDAMLQKCWQIEVDDLISGYEADIKVAEREVAGLKKDLEGFKVSELPDMSELQKNAKDARNHAINIQEKRQQAIQNMSQCEEKGKKAKELKSEYEASKAKEGTCGFCDKQFPQEYLKPIQEKWNAKISGEEHVVNQMRLEYKKWRDQLDNYPDTALSDAVEKAEKLEAELDQFSGLVKKHHEELNKKRSWENSLELVQKELDKLLSGLKEAKENKKIGYTQDYRLLTYLEEFPEAHRDVYNRCKELKGIVEQNEEKITKIDLEHNQATWEVDAADRDIDRERERIAEEKEHKRKPLYDVPSLTAQKTEMESSYKEVMADIDRLSLRTDQYQWWIRKAFGASGLKAYIFEAMLGYLNQCVERYASRLGLAVRFGVDMSKASRPFMATCYKDGNVINYTALSGGEKQKIDIVLAFAVHDLVSSIQDVSVLVMDEVFEGLDKSNIEIVFDLIRIKAEKKAVYVVTHSDTIDSRNTKTIRVVKDDYNSTYVQT